MRSSWGVALVIGACGVACSSFSGSDGSPGGGSSGGSSGDSSDGGIDGPVTGVGVDNEFEIVGLPTNRTYIVQGQTQKVSLHVNRGSRVQGTIQFDFAGLPDGVTTTDTSLPAVVMDPEGNEDLNVTFTAAADAAQKLSQVMITAKTTSEDGAELTATSKFELFLRGPSGSKDTTFGMNGAVSVEAVQSDVIPRILAVGPHDEIYSTAVCANAVGRCIFRFSADGAPDTTWGTTNAQIPLPSVGLASALVQPDGHLVGVGYGATKRAVIYRLNTDGSPDQSFGDGSEGVGTLGLNASSGTTFGGQTLTRANDGSFAFTFSHQTGDGPTMHYYGDVARVTSAGLLVGSPEIWDPNPVGVSVLGVQLKTNRAIVMAATTGVTVGTKYNATELDVSGEPLNQFGGSGNISADYPNANDIQTYEGFIAFDDDNAAFLVSTRVVRVNATGFDAAFGAGGYVELGDKAWSITATPDHKAFYAFTGVLQRRDAATGALDPTFANGGTSTEGVTAYQQGRVRVQSDGRILTLGSGTITRFWN